MKTVTLLATLILFASPPAQAQLLLTNGDFDHDLGGWEFQPFPLTTGYWQLAGNPAGSARIDSDWIKWPPTAMNIYSECFEVEAGEYRLEGDVFADFYTLFEQCVLDLEHWATPDCSGPPLGRTFNPAAGLGAWQRLEVASDIAASGGRGVRVALSLWKESGTFRSCMFDNVVLRGPAPFPHEIPTLGPLGAAALVCALALAATAILRRRT